MRRIAGALTNCCCQGTWYNLYWCGRSSNFYLRQRYIYAFTYQGLCWSQRAVTTLPDNAVILEHSDLTRVACCSPLTYTGQLPFFTFVFENINYHPDMLVYYDVGGGWAPTVRGFLGNLPSLNKTFYFGGECVSSHYATEIVPVAPTGRWSRNKPYESDEWEVRISQLRYSASVQSGRVYADLYAEGFQYGVHFSRILLFAVNSPASCLMEQEYTFPSLYPNPWPGCPPQNWEKPFLCNNEPQWGYGGQCRMTVQYLPHT